MAICRDCCQDMLAANGCSVTHVHVDDVPIARVPYGQERGWDARPDRCHDCGVVRGQVHHLGCDVERCPKCFRQLIMCWCEIQEPGVSADDLRAEAEIEQAIEAWGDNVIDFVARLRRRDGDEEPLPLGAAVAPLRARHAEAVEGFLGWLGSDQIERDAAALAFAALAPHRVDDRHLLHRPDMVAVCNRASQLVTDDDGAMPDDFAETMWSVVRHLADTGGLHPSADRLAALRQPLVCHFGLAPLVAHPARATPAGFCTCFATEDEAPDGSAVVRLATGHIVALVAGDSRSANIALSVFRERVNEMRRDRSMVDLTAHRFVGCLPATRHRPELSCFVRLDVPGRHDGVFLDAGGEAHVPRLDRRYKVGHRWEPIEPWNAVWFHRLPVIHRPDAEYVDIAGQGA